MRAYILWTSTCGHAADLDESRRNSGFYLSPLDVRRVCLS